jgi:glycosyltransferase involved in cell wall biosynthesis
MKVVLISGMLPSGHYSQILAGALSGIEGVDLVVYGENDPKVLELEGCGRVKAVWRRSLLFVVDIGRELLKERADIVHVQQEMSMYGSFATSALLPAVLCLAKVLRVPAVVTVHATVFKNEIDEAFVRIFGKDPKWYRPVATRLYFDWVFRTIGKAVSRVVVHTRLAKRMLCEDYGVREEKVVTVPAVIPLRSNERRRKGMYFLYFGYMVRRKGLEWVLEGFRRFIQWPEGEGYRLILAGGVISGQEMAYEEIVSWIGENGLGERVTVEGFVEENRIDELYQGAYAVTIPARLSMGSSGPLYHARSYGKCVIASSVGHLVEDIEHLKTGILTENGRWDEAFLVAVMNPESVAQIEDNVRILANERHPQVIGMQYARLYRSVIDESLVGRKK